jgi:hypothetical protein
MCKDDDGNYWCDLCGWKITHKCVDANGNYRCDLCGLITAHECADTDGDGNCNYCFYTEAGDVNGNGLINLGDVATLYAHIRHTVTLDEDALSRSDINGDGLINVGDTAKLYQTIRDTAFFG